jgi:hypothetical protein
MTSLSLFEKELPIIFHHILQRNGRIEIEPKWGILAMFRGSFETMIGVPCCKSFTQQFTNQEQTQTPLILNRGARLSPCTLTTKHIFSLFSTNSCHRLCFFVNISSPFPTSLMCHLLFSRSRTVCVACNQ